jgi:hypothetical protein
VGPGPARALLPALAAGALVYLLGGPAATPALATPDWLSPVELSAPGEDGEAPQMGLDAAGDAVAVWDRFDGSHTIIQSAARPAGGRWGQPVGLSAPGRNATEPQVAVDPAGDAVAVWSRTDGAHTIVQAAWRPAGGGWGEATDLSAEGQNAKAPQVAIDPAGNATAVWSRYNSTKYIIQSSRSPVGGPWEMPDDVSAEGQSAENPQVAVDRAGDAVAVWERFDGNHLIVQSASRPAGGPWAAAEDLSAEGENAEAPQVAIGPAGDAIAVWTRFDGSDFIVQSASKPGGGAWAFSGDLSEKGRSAESPQVALDPAGDAVAVWTRENEGLTTIVQGADRSAGGAWSAPAPLSSTGLAAAEGPEVSIDPAGNAAAVWAVSDSSPSVVQTAIKPAGGPWQAHETLSVIGRNATEPQVALDRDGDGVAIWTRENGSNKIVQAIGYDRAGPQMPGVSIPAAGTVHQPLFFSVSPFDVWSAIGPIGWSFGDGEGGSGAALRHAYGFPGVYRVGVTAADVLGNSSAASGTVTIYPKANASRNVRVRGGRALLRLRCPSPGGCEGTLRLMGGVRFQRHGRRFSRRVEIGATAFDIPGATTTTVPVRLNAQGKALVREAPRSGVKAQLTGPGVKHRLVALFGPRPRR